MASPSRTPESMRTAAGSPPACVPTVNSTAAGVRSTFSVPIEGRKSRSGFSA